MSKLFAFISFIALIVHAAFFKEASLASASAALGLAVLFAGSAVLALRDWLTDMVES